MDYFAEFEKLRMKVPRLALINTQNQNSDYTLYALKNKNCYMCFGADFNEDCYYCLWFYRGRDSTDCSYCHECELCYDSVDLLRCYNCNFCQDLKDSVDCDYSYNLIGCEKCFGGVNLRRQKFHIFNQPFSKEEYEAKVAELKKLPREQLQAQLDQIKLKAPHVYAHQLDNENATGDYIFNSRNSWACFDSKDVDDCGYLNNAIGAKDCWDCSWLGHDCRLCYECVSAPTLYNCDYCACVWWCQDMEYCEYCFNSHDCFLCVGLNHAEYCILNRQYSEEEYFQRKKAIRDELIREGIYHRGFWETEF